MKSTQTGKKQLTTVTVLADKALKALKFLYPDKPVHELKQDIEAMERGHQQHQEVCLMFIRKP